MKSGMIETLTRFGEVMERENAALRAMDLKSAAAFLPEKRDLVAAITALDETDARAAPVTLRPLADRLKTLTLENKALLERALAAQNKLLEVVTSAITAARRSSYTASGRLSGRPSPLSLLERV